MQSAHRWVKLVYIQSPLSRQTIEHMHSNMCLSDQQPVILNKSDDKVAL